LQAGDALTVLDGRGGVFSCELVSSHRDQVQVSVRETARVPAPRCPLTLFQAVTKAKSFQWIIQKATELGVTRLVPVLTRHAVPDIEQATTKREKWHWIAVDALKQSGSAWLPHIQEPLRLDQILQGSVELCELNLLAALGPNARHPRAWLDEFTARHQRLPASLSLWIGPEGDFAPAEAAALAQAGARPITLGEQVLRSETAALCCLAVVQSELAWLGARL
jgi:16S rRNA (uracil1498-N3)-methyltransferase